jgi:hypothetical protein
VWRRDVPCSLVLLFVYPFYHAANSRMLQEADLPTRVHERVHKNPWAAGPAAFPSPRMSMHLMFVAEPAVVVLRRIRHSKTAERQYPVRVSFLDLYFIAKSDITFSSPTFLQTVQSTFTIASEEARAASVRWSGGEFEFLLGTAGSITAIRKHALRRVSGSRIICRSQMGILIMINQLKVPWGCGSCSTLVTGGILGTVPFVPHRSGGF